MNNILLRYARPYYGALARIAVLTSASSLVLLAVPWLAGQLLGGIVSARPAGQSGVVLMLVAALLIMSLISYAVATQSAVTSARLLADLRQRVYDHVQRLPIGFHESRGKGDTLALLTYEIARLSQFMTGTLVAIPARLLTTLGAMVLMFRIDPRLALIVPLLVPAFYLILKIVGRRLRSLARELQHAEAQVVEVAEEMLVMLPATKAFTREMAESERYRAKVAQASDLREREGRIYAGLDPLIALVAALAAVLILLLAGRSVEAGNLSAANLFSFIFYAALLTRPVGALAHVYGEVQTARGTLARMQMVLDEPTEKIASSGPVVAAGDRARGAIAFDEVDFGYPGRRQLLKGVSFAIAPGEKVALLGSNGAGKTALINLLMRYYEPQGGAILLDGRDVSAIGVTELRRQIGLVPQSPLLFNGTIRANIAFGAENPSSADIEAAARHAQADEFIHALPQGMETLIGDGGVRLSGGQRQRIALARALIKDPPVLVFDEATSMFDSDGEDAFISACEQALSSRTVILITHRPATLALADRAFILEGGTLREKGLETAVSAKASA